MVPFPVTQKFNLKSATMLLSSPWGRWGVRCVALRSAAVAAVAVIFTAHFCASVVVAVALRESSNSCIVQNIQPDSSGTPHRCVERYAVDLGTCERSCRLDSRCRLFVWDAGKRRCTMQLEPARGWRTAAGVFAGLPHCAPTRPCAASCQLEHTRLVPASQKQPLEHVGVKSRAECHAFCEAQAGCNAFSFAEASRTCVLLWSEAVERNAGGWTSSFVTCCETASSSEETKVEYILSRTYSGWDLADPKHFTFFTANDPTHGFVDYFGRDEAIRRGLFRVTEEGHAIIAVENSTTVADHLRGRPSVRLEGATTVSDGIIAFSAIHMPEGCAVWPAFWTLGEGSWPAGGEIDIVEGANDQVPTSTCLHTRRGCNFAAAPAPVMTGHWKAVPGRRPPEEATNCDTQAYGNNLGCCINWPTRSSFGRRFNAEGGGVFVVEWVHDFHIRVWLLRHSEAELFNRSSNSSSSDLALDITRFLRRTVPAAVFPLRDGCRSQWSLDPIFQPQRIVLNIALCGDWAAGTFFEDGCGMLSATAGPFGLRQAPRSKTAFTPSPVESCVRFVRNYPRAFRSAYWHINYIKIFERAP